MVGDNRRASELRDASAILSDLGRKAPGGYGSNSTYWRDIQTSIDDINRELGGNSGGGYQPPPPPQKPVIGRATWRGMVDNKVQIKIKDSIIETITIAGTAYGAGEASALLRRFLVRVRVCLSKASAERAEGRSGWCSSPRVPTISLP